MKKRLFCTGLLLCLLSASSDLRAQLISKERFSIEPRVGIAFPTGDFGDVDPNCPAETTGCDYPGQTGVEAGFQWDVRIHYQLTDRVSAVGSYGKTTFGCSGPFCGFGPDPEAQDLSFGVRTQIFTLGSMGIWIEGGGMMEKFSIIRTRNTAGEPETTRVWYPWSPGVYGGGGVELPLTGEGNFFFTPGFHLRHVPSDPPDSHPDLQPVTATSVLVEVGFKVLLKG